MKTTDIFCRKKSRERLEKEGFTPSEAFLIATDTMKTIEGVVDGKNIQQRSGKCKTCEKDGSVQ